MLHAPIASVNDHIMMHDKVPLVVPEKFPFDSEFWTALPTTKIKIYSATRSASGAGQRASLAPWLEIGPTFATSTETRDVDPAAHCIHNSDAATTPPMIEDTSIEDVLDDAELVDLVALLIERLHGHFLTDPLRLRRALSVLGRRFVAPCCGAAISHPRRRSAPERLR